jgi:hypothetical protein
VWRNRACGGNVAWYRPSRPCWCGETGVMPKWPKRYLSEIWWVELHWSDWPEMPSLWNTNVWECRPLLKYQKQLSTKAACSVACELPKYRE